MACARSCSRSSPSRESEGCARASSSPQGSRASPPCVPPRSPHSRGSWERRSRPPSRSRWPAKRCREQSELHSCRNLLQPVFIRLCCLGGISTEIGNQLMDVVGLTLKRLGNLPSFMGVSNLHPRPHPFKEREACVNRGHRITDIGVQRGLSLLELAPDVFSNQTAGAPAVAAPAGVSAEAAAARCPASALAAADEVLEDDPQAEQDDDEVHP